MGAIVLLLLQEKQASEVSGVQVRPQVLPTSGRGRGGNGMTDTHTPPGSCVNSGNAKKLVISHALLVYLDVL